MIVRIIEKNGKWEHRTYCIDSDKLDPKNPVDVAISKELKKAAKRKKKRELYVSFDASDLDKYDGDPAEVSNRAVVGDDDQVLWITMDYCG